MVVVTSFWVFENALCILKTVFDLVPIFYFG